MDDDLSYKSLRKIQHLEKTSPQFSKLPEHFYSTIHTLLHSMEITEQQEENTQKKMLLHDEFLKTKKIAQSIYEYREKKLVQAALSTIRSGKPDLSNLIDQEQVVYEQLLKTMKDGRQTLWERQQSSQQSQPQQEQQPRQQDAINKDAAPPVQPPKNTNPVLRITEDIPSFMGTDMKEYNLRKHDVLTLPKEMADPLIKQKVATKIH